MAAESTRSLAHKRKYASLYLRHVTMSNLSSTVQVILSGHVPPATFYDQCYDRFAEITLAYQDIIIASIFGHANVDHFTIFTHEEDKRRKKRKHKAFSSPYSALSAANLPDNLQEAYSGLPKHPNADNYAFNHIAPSVIPTYQPAFRIWTYNTSMADGAIYNPELESTTLLPTVKHDEDEWDIVEVEEEETDLLPTSSLTQQPIFFSLNDSLSTLKHKKRKSKRRRRKKKQPKYEPIPRHVSSSSPSRSNRFGTLLGYVQYYLPLGKVNAHHGWGQHPSNSSSRPFPEFEVEYTTYTAKNLEKLLENWPDSESLIAKGKEAGNMIPYEMPDLTIGSWLDLTSRLSKGGNVWKGYVKRMFVQTRD